MIDQIANRVVVVLSPGRSGTSLLMKVLYAMGMKLSETMIPGTVGNPEGFYEDSEIVEVHKKLLQELNTHPVLPLPDGWIDSGCVKRARLKLRTILENRLPGTNEIWGFKDPRTASFLPMWSRILNVPGAIPIFLLAVRDPKSVVVSLKRQINREESITELQWLIRITDALHHTASDCFIVHYEDWFSRPVALAKELLEYTGLRESFTGDVEATMKEIVKLNLNRSVYEDYEVKNKHARKLYGVLKGCQDGVFDRARLMAEVKDCREAMNGFKGWYVEAQKHIAQQTHLKKRLEKEPQHDNSIDVLKISHAELEKDLHDITLQNNESLKQIKDLCDENDDLRIRLSTTRNDLVLAQKATIPPQKDNNSMQVKELKKQVQLLRTSTSFRVGNVLVMSVIKPGKNTILMPFRFVKIIFGVLFSRR